MTVTLAPPAQTGMLTYDEYLNEGIVYGRYDIIDGERIFMTQPTDGHQDVVLNVAELLRGYQRRTAAGKAMVAPCDILITRTPLRTRQPDVLLISWQRYGERTTQTAEPMAPAPELAVEVLSPSETRSIRAGKIRDYCAVGVLECWVVNLDAQTVEVLRLTPGGPVREALYGEGQSVQSLTFPGLSLALEDVFHVEQAGRLF